MPGTSIGSIKGTITLRDQFTGALKRASLQLEKHGKKMEKAGKRMSEVGSQLTRAVTLPLIAIGGASVKMASDFESSFAGVRKTVNATEQEFSALAQGMRDLSQEIPVNVNELNRIGEAAGQLGIETENILGFTRVVADLGVTTNMSSEQAATSLARLANITGLPQTEFDRLGSTIVDLGNNFATTESEITEFGLRIAGAGDIAGLAESEILGIGAAMSSVGIEAQAGGTAVQKVLLGMVKAVSTGSEELEVFARTAGMSAAEFADTFERDAGGAFARFVQGLGEQGDKAFDTLEALSLQDQRLIRSFLSLANAGDLLERTMEVGNRAFEENTALVTEAEQRYKTFESQLKLFWNRLKDVAITLGQALIPILRDALEASEPLIRSMASMAEAFGRQPPVVRKIVLALGALVAALGPAVFVSGQLITAWGTLATSAPRVAAAITSLINPVNLLAAAFVGLLLAINNAITKWREAMQLEIEGMVSQANRVGQAMKDLRAALREGEIGSGELERARNLSKSLGEEIATVRDRIKEAKGKLDTLTADQWLMQKEKVEELEKELSRLGSDKKNLDQFLGLAANLPVVLTESGDAADGAGDGLGDLPDILDDVTDSMADAIAENEALLDALIDSSEQYEILNTLLDAGVPLADALSGAYDEQAQSLIRASKALEKELELREEEKELLTSILDLREKIARLKESSINTSGDIEMPDLEPVFPVIDPAALEKMNEDWQATVGQMSVAFEEMQKQAWRNVQDFAAESIAGIFDEWIDTGNDALDQFLESIVKMLAQLFVLWLANLAKRVAAEQAAAAASAATWAATGAASGGFSGGGGAGMLGNLGASAISKGVFGGSGTGWASTLAAAAPILLVAGLALWGYAKAASTQKSHTGGQVQFGVGTQMGVAFNDSLKMARQMHQALQVLQDTFAEIERVTGASINILEQAVINVKNNGKIFVNIGEEFSVQVADMAEALDLVVTKLLRSAEISGGSAAIRAALENSVATSIDELQAEIASALRSEELFLGMEGRTAIREKTNEFFELLNKEIELGIIQAQGGSGALVGLVNSYQANFDRLMGITRDAGEVARQEAKAHNAALKMDIARLMALRAEILATGASAEATALNAQVNAGGARVMLQMAEVTASATEVQAGYAEVMAGGAKVTHGMMEVQAAATEATATNAQAQGALAETQAAGAQVALTAAQASAAALEAIDEALAALEGLEVDLDAAAAAARRAGQGGGPGADMEQLRDLIDQMRFDRLLLGMTELEAGLARLDREYQRQLEMAHGNAELIAALTEEYRLQEEQLRRQIQLSAVDTFQQFMGIGADPFSQLQTGFDEAVTAIEEAGFGAERTARMIGRLTASYQRQLDVLSREEFVGIGDALMGIVDRYYSGVEGFEEFRMRLERVRFELEMANLRARFEILKAEGSLAQAVLDEMQSVFDFIAENPIDWEAFVTPAIPRAASAAREVNNTFEEMARRLKSAKESIRDFLASLQTGAFGGRSNKQMFEAAQDQFQKIRQGVQAGNIQAIEQFPEVARRFLEIARERFGSTAKFQEILAQVEKTGVGALGVEQVREDNVVFPQKFFQQQALHVQVDKSGHKSVADAVKQGFALQAAEEERSREDILLELRGLRDSQEALNLRLAAIEGNRRTRKAS